MLPLPLQLVQDGATVLCALPAPLCKLLAECGTAGLAAGSVPRHLLLQPSIQQRSHPASVALNEVFRPSPA